MTSVSSSTVVWLEEYTIVSTVRAIENSHVCSHSVFLLFILANCDTEVRHLLIRLTPHGQPDQALKSRPMNMVQSLDCQCIHLHWHVHHLQQHSLLSATSPILLMQSAQLHHSHLKSKAFLGFLLGSICSTQLIIIKTDALKSPATTFSDQCPSYCQA